MITYGLIGKRLGHSFSQKYFSTKFNNLALNNTTYKNFELSNIEEFPNLINNNPEIVGLNITIPYKQDIIPFLDDISAVAAKIQAVNTIIVNRTKDGIFLYGDNTDVLGFKTSLIQFITNNSSSPINTLKAIILGTGGASQAVSFVLKELNIEHIFVSRKPIHNQQISYSDINKSIINKYHLIINTTPKGMYPNIDESPDIPYHFLGKNHFLFDLIYNPTETEFLAKGRLQNSKTKNGQEMLEIQAEESWNIWHQK